MMTLRSNTATNSALRPSLGTNPGRMTPGTFQTVAMAFCAAWVIP